MSSRPEILFSPDDRRAMLALARAAILGALMGEPLVRQRQQPSCLSLCHGVFVTLHVHGRLRGWWRDRKSTRLNSSHSQISYAVFCLKKKTSNAQRRSSGSRQAETDPYLSNKHDRRGH